MKDPNGALNACEEHEIKALDSLQIVYRESDLNDDKGGVWVINWVDAEKGSRVNGSYTEPSTLLDISYNFDGENKLVGLWGRNEELRPQQLSVITFTPSPACKALYEPKVEVKDTPKEPVVEEPESNDTVIAIAIIITLLVVFVIFLILIIWDNKRVANIRARDNSFK